MQQSEVYTVVIAYRHGYVTEVGYTNASIYSETALVLYLGANNAQSLYEGTQPVVGIFCSRQCMRLRI